MTPWGEPAVAAGEAPLEACALVAEATSTSAVSKATRVQRSWELKLKAASYFWQHFSLKNNQKMAFVFWLRSFHIIPYSSVRPRDQLYPRCCSLPSSPVVKYLLSSSAVSLGKEKKV